VAGACLRELITQRSENGNSKKTLTSLHVTSLYSTLVSKCCIKQSLLGNNAVEDGLFILFFPSY